MIVRTVVLAALLAAPTIAAPATDCATTPAQLRAAAASATDVAAQRKALMFVTTGEKLCGDNAKFEASQKFAAAAKALKVDLAALPATTLTAQ